jgi:hypothetical protein
MTFSDLETAVAESSAIFDGIAKALGLTVAELASL